MVKSRPVRVPGFGARLTALRGERSAEAVVRQMARLGVSFTSSTLYQYEHGTVAAPDPVVLWALATVYGVPVADLVGSLAAERTGKAAADEDTVTICVSAIEKDRLDRLRELSPEQQRLVIGMLDQLSPPRVEKPEQKPRTRSA